MLASFSKQSANPARGGRIALIPSAILRSDSNATRVLSSPIAAPQPIQRLADTRMGGEALIGISNLLREPISRSYLDSEG